jgi:hypothetical protein
LTVVIAQGWFACPWAHVNPSARCTNG